MKRITGRLDRISRDFDGNGIVSFTVPDCRQLAEIRELDPKKDYAIEIKEINGKRTLRQNRYMWALITEIDKAINGRPSEAGMEAVYIDCLERANAKIDFICCKPEAERMLRESFRAVKYISTVQAGAQEMNLYKVVLGSSKMNTREMTALVDTVLDYAEEAGIGTSYWREVMS